MLVRVRGLAVLVRAQESEIDAVAWIGEVVRVTAELRGLQVRNAHQADVVVHLVLVEMDDCALVEAHNLGHELRISLPGRVEDGLLVCLALFLDLDLIVSWRDTFVDPVGDVRHPDELRRGQPLGSTQPQPDLLFHRHGDESGLEHLERISIPSRSVRIKSRCDRIAHAAGARHDQALARDERRGAESG